MAGCHVYPKSKSAKEGQAKAQGKSRLAAAGGMTDSVFEQRKREQIRRLFMPPAKTFYPQQSAIPVSNRRLCDKKAEDIYLQRHQAIGSRRYFGRRKSAKSAQKADFSLDGADQVGFSL